MDGSGEHERRYEREAMNPVQAFDAFSTQIATSKGASVLVVIMLLLIMSTIPATANYAPFVGICIILTQLYGGKNK